jgi:transposase
MRPQRFIKKLTKNECQEIENLYRKGPTNRVRKRAQAIRLSAKNYTIPQISEILGCNQQSIHNWFNTFEKDGFDGLYDKPRASRPVIATSEYRVSLVKAIKTSPRDLGYPFTV